MTDVVAIGKYAVANFIKEHVRERTGYEIDIIDDRLFARWEASSEPERNELLELLVQQAWQSAGELNLE